MVIGAVSASTFTTRLPGGGHAELRFDEVLGRTCLIYGGFEIAESRALRALAEPGTTAVDVGANVGLLTICLADAVGRDGAVWAFEPFPSTVERLHQNVRLNGFTNGEIFELAVTDAESRAVLKVANDPAYHSLGTVYENRDSGHGVEVATTRLDSIWQAQGMPRVSVIKIDTEGTEAAVVAGAEALIEACRPALVVEAPSPVALSSIANLLSPYQYAEARHHGTSRVTHIFLHQRA
jgi:FkbM family methyltransferase